MLRSSYGGFHSKVIVCGSASTSFDRCHTEKTTFEGSPTLMFQYLRSCRAPKCYNRVATKPTTPPAPLNKALTAFNLPNLPSSVLTSSSSSGVDSRSVLV